jgi:phosphoadenosine phosphosulfate reductase
VKPQLWQIPSSNLSTAHLQAKLDELVARLTDIKTRHGEVKFATSLAAEDMVLTDAIVHAKVDIHLFTLETGRLHAQTVQMIDTVEKHYGVVIERLYPAQVDVDQFISQYGLNGFYDSEEAKKACCNIRKVKLLNQALITVDAWLSGQRREQAVTRADLPFEEKDADRGVAKFNPLFDWTEADVWAYLEWRGVPMHPLHLQGYPSIGCEPCTRAIKQGEDVRAGRWWWLQQESKECGLHVK